MFNFLRDRIHVVPRIWSNGELNKFSHLFSGDIANISGWQDEDKSGRHYKDYFPNATSYTITNYKSEARGWQGKEGEIFLNLEDDLPETLKGNFDVVFNHTTLEHVYLVQKAFANICGMTKDIAIIVLPFLQPYHADYGDYWRFTPLAVKRMFEDNGLSLLHLSFNKNKVSSVYIFAIASKKPENWNKHFDSSFDLTKDPTGKGPEPFIGCHAFTNLGHKLDCLLRYPLKHWFKTSKHGE